MNSIYRFFGTFSLIILLFLGISVFFESCKGKNETDVVYEDSEEDDYNTDEEIYDEYFESTEEASRAGIEVDDVGKSEVDPEYQAVEQDQSGYVDNFSFEANENEAREINAATKTEPQSKPASRPARAVSSSSGGNYLVVAGSYLIKDNAQKMVDKLKNLGYSNAEIVNFDESKYHSISAGRFSSYDEASNVASQIKSKGIDCYVHTRK